MIKKIVIIALLPIIAIAILMAYIFVPGAKYQIGNIFGSISAQILNGLTSVGNLIVTTPYGLPIFGILTFLGGVLFTNKCWDWMLNLRRGMVTQAHTDLGFQTNVGMATGSSLTPATNQPVSATVPPLEEN